MAFINPVFWGHTTLCLTNNGSPTLARSSETLSHHCCAGMQAVSEPLKVTQIQPSGELLHSLLGLSHAKAPDQLLSANTAGFIYVSDVNPVTRTISFLAPCPGPLPCKYLLSGSLRVIL